MAPQIRLTHRTTLSFVPHSSSRLHTFIRLLPRKAAARSPAQPSSARSRSSFQSPPAATSEPRPPFRPLRHLPFGTLLRTLAVTTFTSSPSILSPALRVLSAVAYHPHPLLNPDKNPLVRWLLRSTLYRHFCAGESPAAVQQTLARLRQQGVGEVILGWAREIEKRGEKFDVEDDGQHSDDQEIRQWQEGSARTISMVPAGQFAALK